MQPSGAVCWSLTACGGDAGGERWRVSYERGEGESANTYIAMVILIARKCERRTGRRKSKKTHLDEALLAAVSTPPVTAMPT